MKESTPPPPLPESLSSRLQSSMNPLTGQCKFHPKVQLCELVQNNTRWVVRRKICYKCGSRPKGAGKHHMPGRCVSNVSRESKLIREKTETSERGRQLRRSSSLMRSTSRSSLRSSSQSPADGSRGRGLSRSSSERKSSQAPADGARGRGRSASATRKTRSRSASVGASGRERLNSSSRNVVQRRSTSVSRERVARAGEDEKKKERSSHRHSKSMTAMESNTRVKSSNIKTEANDHSKENKTSYRERALEFTQKAMEASEDKGYSQAIVPRANTEPDHLDDTDDFDESDPIIMIPNIHLDDTSLPPPPPRTSEERQIHEYRQELRRKHIRQQRRELSTSKSVDVAEQKSEQKKSSSTRRHSTSKSTGIEDTTTTSPSTELRKSRQYRDGGRQSASKPRKRPDSPTPVSASPVHPSLAVLTALEIHRQKVEDEEPEATQVTVADRQQQSRKRTSHDRKEKVVKIHDSAEVQVVTDDGDHADEDAESETSSISSASAKVYQMQPESANELRSRHPELKGVVSDPPQFPPVDVTVDRSRSRSRSRPRITVDAPEERQLVVHKSSSRQLSATHGNGSAVKRRPSKIEVEKKSSREQDATASDDKEVKKRSSDRQLLKTSSSRRPRPPQKSPTASSDRTSKRTTRSYSGRVRGAERSDLSGRRTTKSAERSLSVAKSSPALIEGNQRRCKSAATSRSGRSPHTSVTQPESLSSEEFLQKSTSKEEAVVIYKKTATKHSLKGDQTSEGVKPMTAIRISEDEKSHASSISAGSRSTIEESSDFKGEDKIPRGSREKAASVLKDVKGSAKNLAVKGKSAFGGLKGTSKKWQSALFV